MKYFSFTRILLATLLFLVAGVSTGRAASYDYYVKDGASGDGSESDPFGSISDAIDELKDKGGDSIYVAKGSYSESFTLPKGAELAGADQGDVIITGLVQMGDDTKLSKVTLASGGSILALKGADVAIEKVRVKNAPIVGIKAEEGRGTITIRDSIVEGSRKGLYMQAGNNLRFEGLEVRDNTEEGLDIREKVSGTIEKSEFRDNGESGIEVVLGDANIIIRSNTFSGNGASGIAAQFFKGAKDVGDVKVEGNRMSKNDYGIDCKAPQGGSSRFYYLNSLRISGNTFVDNRDGEIAKSCKIMTDEERILFEAEEKKKAEEVAEAKTLTLTSEMLADRAAKAAVARKEYDDMRLALEAERINPSLLALAGITERLRTSEESFASRSKVRCFFVGDDVRTEKALRLALTEMTPVIETIEKESALLEFDANRRLVEEVMGNIREREMSIESSLAAGQSCSFSLFGWAMKLVESRRAAPRLLSAEEKALSLQDRGRVREVLFLGDLAYHPKLRRGVVKGADDFFLQGLRDEFRRFDLVTGSLAVPLLTDVDPLPSTDSSAVLAFPTRFSNVFAAANIRFMHLGSTLPFAREKVESFEKTANNLSQAGISSFGGISEGITETKPLPGLPLSVLEFRETKTSSADTLREKIKNLKATGETVVVYLVFDRALGAAVGDDRRNIARSFVDAGAVLVLGSGLSIAPESEIYQSGQIAYSQGFILDEAVSGLEKTSRSLGFIIKLNAAGDEAIVEDRALSFDETSGLSWKE